jgi:hypothetical protein
MGKGDTHDVLLRDELARWWESRPLVSDVFSPLSMRQAALGLLTGANYRVLTERCVREKIHLYHSWLLQLASGAKRRWGSRWRQELIQAVLESPGRGALLQYLHFWLVGLTKKTADNTDVIPSQPQQFQDFLQQMLALCDEVAQSAKWKGGNVTLGLRNCDTGETQDLTLAETLWLTQIVGANTLTVRGSNKAVFGKRVEQVFLRAALECLGFERDRTYWLAIGRDELVDREADAEVETKRGRVRIDVGLIGTGNQEVSEDKLSRVGANGIVIVDRLGRRSTVGTTADKLRVKLIQIRHNFVLNEMYSHLQGKTRFDLRTPPTTKDGIAELLRRLPDDVFTI